ncbi:MAG: glucoamylase family protein [Lacipirellulaceae bacterium]
MLRAFLRRAGVFAALASLMAPVGAAAATSADTTAHARHVFFESSSGAAAYYHSAAECVAPSRLETALGRAPVERTRSHSAPNCVRLAWTSAFGGDWRVHLKAPTRYGKPVAFEGDTLVMWVYSPEGLVVDDSPRVSLTSVGGGSTNSVALLSLRGTLAAGEWVRLEFPPSAFQGLFGGTDRSTFDLGRLEEVGFVQGLDDGKPHVLLVDDIRVVNARDLADTTPPAPPTGLTAEGAELHIELAWTASASDDVVSYGVDRSTAGGAFERVATRPAWFSRAVDFLAKPGDLARYRLTAIDRAGNESAPTAIVTASTRPFSDDELLTMAQRGCFRYYWDLGHPVAGMAIEVLPGDDNLVALGASGFGVMALVVGAERGFAPREAVAERVLKIVRFLAKADRFHGVWPHFFDGQTGRTNAFFGPHDNGGDLVETAFMIQGLLAARQYFDRDDPVERELRDTVTRLWREVEWDWHRRDASSPVLYWHWSPDKAWVISHPLIGWNETMIVYLLAIASPTHAVPAEMFYTGFAGTDERAIAYRRSWSRTTDGDHYTNGKTYGRVTLDVGCGNGGELFFNQFSFLGFDPRGKRDKHTNYARNNRNIALLSHAYAVENPRGRKGYGASCWGRSAGINSGGGRAQPRDDNGTICSSAALGVMPFTPDESMAALRHFYRELGPRVWGAYGFHDGFNETEDWFEEVYMGLNQAQIVVMIENHRTGLLWRSFMANPEVAPALEAIGFEPDPDGDR